MGTLGRQQRQTCCKDTISVNKKGVNENKTCRMMDALGRQQRQTCRQEKLMFLFYGTLPSQTNGAKVIHKKGRTDTLSPYFMERGLLVSSAAAQDPSSPPDPPKVPPRAPQTTLTCPGSKNNYFASFFSIT